MKYDCEVPVHDILGQQTGINQRRNTKNFKLFFFIYFYQILVTKGDSMRKVIQHIDERNWRTLEYFRMLDKKAKLELDKKKVTFDIVIRCLHRNLFFLIYIH
jgi:hypothetical protein